MELTITSYSLDIESSTFTEKLENDRISIEYVIFVSHEYTELLLDYVMITRIAS